MYPVHVDVQAPERFERQQVALRVAIAIVLGAVGITMGWIVALLYGALPIVAAIAISTGADIRPRLWRVLAWLLQLDAYMLIVVDRFPAGTDEPVRVEARTTGTPTVGSALARLVTSIPSGIVLMLLWFVSSLLWIVSAITVLATETVPPSIQHFQRGIVRWNARLLAYHAALVDEYPPFTMSDDSTLAVAP